MQKFNLNKKRKNLEDTFYININNNIDKFNKIDSSEIGWEIPSIKNNNISSLDLEILKMEIKGEIKNFLLFLEYKGLIQKDEYKEFLESKLVAERLIKVNGK